VEPGSSRVTRNSEGNKHVDKERVKKNTLHISVAEPQLAIKGDRTNKTKFKEGGSTVLSGGRSKKITGIAFTKEIG